MDVVYALRDEVQELKQVGSEFVYQVRKVCGGWYVCFFLVRKGSKFISLGIYKAAQDESWVML